MNDAVPPAGRPLAHEPDFALGPLRVRPSLGAVEADGAREHLEPRVMQVLVALVRADGATLSRDDLIASCWSGVVVGEDAINRVIGRLRRLARAHGGFELETVPRVGWRLLRVDPPAPPAPPGPDAALPAAARRRLRPAVLGLAAGVLALAAVAGALAVRQLGSGEWRVDGYEVLSDAPGWERKPDLSPDGRFVVYSAAPPEDPQTDKGDIFMRNLSGGESVRLVAGPEHDNAPAFSPEGDRIAFIRSNTNPETVSLPAKESCRLVVKPLPEGAERVVGRCPNRPGSGTLDWTADGRGLIFPDIDAQLTARIMRLDLATGAVRALTDPPPGGRDFSGADSPDGRRLAFVRFTSWSASDLWVQDLRSGELTRITRVGAFIPTVDWSPDGRTLFFSSELGGGGSSLWSVPASGRGEPQRLLIGLRQVGRLSTAAGKLAVETAITSSRILREGPGGEREVVAFNGVVDALDVSRAGDLVFVTADDDWWLWLQPRGQPARRRLKLAMGLPRAMRWSPDGRSVAFIGDFEGRGHVHVLPVDGGGPRRLPTPTGNLTSVAWTEGGRALAFGLRDAVGWRIWRVGLEAGSRPRPITRPGFAWVQSTSDGTLYAGGPEEFGSMWRLGPGAPARVLSWPGEGWRVTDAGALFTRRDAPGAWLQPFGGGPPVVLTRGRVDDGSGTVDPTTGEFVFARRQREEQDLGLLHLSRQ